MPPHAHRRAFVMARTPVQLTEDSHDLLRLKHQPRPPKPPALSAGIEVAGLRLDVARHAEAALAAMVFTVREASVGALRLDLPTWRGAAWCCAPPASGWFCSSATCPRSADRG